MLCWSRESRGSEPVAGAEGSHLCLQRNGSGAAEGAELCRPPHGCLGQLRVPGQALMAPWPALPPTALAGTEADMQGAPGWSAEGQPNAKPMLGSLTEQC